MILVAIKIVITSKKLLELITITCFLLNYLYELLLFIVL